MINNDMNWSEWKSAVDFLFLFILGFACDLNFIHTGNWILFIIMLFNKAIKLDDYGFSNVRA